MTRPSFSSKDVTKPPLFLPEPCQGPPFSSKVMSRSPFFTKDITRPLCFQSHDKAPFSLPRLWQGPFIPPSCDKAPFLLPKLWLGPLFLFQSHGKAAFSSKGMARHMTPFPVPTLRQGPFLFQNYNKAQGPTHFSSKVKTRHKAPFCSQSYDKALFLLPKLWQGLLLSSKVMTMPPFLYQRYYKAQGLFSLPKFWEKKLFSSKL